MLLRCMLIASLCAAIALTWASDSRAQKADFREQIRENRKTVVTDAEVADEVLARNDKRREELRKRLADLQVWTSAQFEIGEREVIDKPKILANRLKKAEEQRENEIYRLLNFSEKSAGGIETGKALNTLLEVIGPAARDNAEARKLNPLYGVQLSAGTTGVLIDEKLWSGLGWQDNTLGAKATGKINQDPIDVEWPQILKDPRFAESRHAIEEARERLLTDLRAGKGVSSELEKAMRDAVANLNRDYAEYTKQWIKNPPPRASRPAEYQRLCYGKRHIEKLITSTYQVVEARGIEEVAPAAQFAGGNIEDFVAYMQVNNLRFSPPSKTTDRRAYYTVFNQMLRYYLDLKAVTNAEREIDEEIARLDQIDARAVATALDHRPVVNVVAPVDVKFIQDLVK